MQLPAFLIIFCTFRFVLSGVLIEMQCKVIPFIQLYTRWHIYQIENYIYIHIYIHCIYTTNMYIREKVKKCL